MPEDDRQDAEAQPPQPPQADIGTALGQRVLICDGAMGTMLHAAGNSLDRSLTELNLSNPGLVSTIHESYVSAGADVILTNTFGASGLRLEQRGFGEFVRDINVAGAQLAAGARDGAGGRAMTGQYCQVRALSSGHNEVRRTLWLRMLIRIPPPAHAEAAH